MDDITARLSGMELNTIHIVSIILLLLYLLASGIGFASCFLMGRGYFDLAKGLRRILERQNHAGILEDIPALAGEIQNYYDRYTKYNPSIKERYASIINWLDDILLQTNMFSDSVRKRKRKFGIWFDEYYDTLVLVQQWFVGEQPFYRCTLSQVQVLKGISELQNGENNTDVKKLIQMAEGEFVRLNAEGKKNERTNYVSIAIGVAGILVSVLLTILQMFG